MTLKEIRTFIYLFSRNYGVKIRWQPPISTSKEKYPSSGWYVPDTKVIHLRKVKNADEGAALLSVFFHELQHHLNEGAGRLYQGHPAHDTDLAEEFYTDRLAALRMKKIFPKMKYVFGYQDATLEKMLAEEKEWERQAAIKAAKLDAEKRDETGHLIYTHWHKPQ